MLTTIEDLNVGLLAIEPNYGRFFINNLPYGMGITLGNSLRRILLSYIQGAAIFYVKINNALHEYEVISGVKEDIIEIILNLKKVRFKYRSSSEWEKVFINFTGPGQVKAKEIRCPALVEVVNPEQYIATVNTDITLSIEAGVKLGYGYIPAEEQVLPDESVGYIKVDSIFSPVEKVNYYVENERNENNQLTDKLYLEIYTDGSVLPKEALIKALNILRVYVDNILKGYASEKEIGNEMGIIAEPLASKEKSIINKNIKELGLSSRTLNSLRRMGINTLGDLLKYTEDDLITIRNLGGKSIQEVKEKLKEYGLSLRES